MDGLFYSIMTTLYTGWDPDKDPPDAHGPCWGHLQDPAAGGTNLSVHNLISYCQEQARAPVQLLTTLELLLSRAEHMKPTLFNYGPKYKRISEKIQKNNRLKDL